MTTSSSQALPLLLEATATYANNPQMKHLGQEMFRMYTEVGFPPDMFLDQLNKHTQLPLLARIFIVSEYHTAFLEHRRKSGVSEQRLDAIRRRNREDIERLITTGELGIY